MRTSHFVLLLASALCTASANAADPDPTYLAPLLSSARARGVARDPAWLRLGHWRKPLLGRLESEADGPAFFLSPQGRRDPAAELEATLRGFFDPEPIAPADAAHDHPQCRFPARFAFLVRELDIDLTRLPPRACPRFEAFLQRVGARSVTFVFSSYYLNNPSSAFGHTFLRLGKAEHDLAGDRLDLIDQGVDYAAAVDTSNALSYAFKGFTGLFQGHFTARPYFYKVREYADYESRDLWDYELALSPAERGLLASHLWELGQTWFDYYYATKNCSYHILGALEAAAPRLRLLSRVGKFTLPADAVKALFANPGLVRSVRFRPSSRTQLMARTATLSGSQLDLVTSLAEGEDPERFQRAPELERVRMLDTALDLVDVRHGRAIVQGTDPSAEGLRQRLLERRSTIAVPSDPLVVAPPSVGGPEHGHGFLRLGVGGGASTADGPLIVLSERLALHDLADPPTGFSPRTQLEFLKLELALRPRAGDLRFDEASLVEATSLNTFDRLERRISWKMRLGASRVNDTGCTGCIAGRFEVGGGPALLTQDSALAAALTADAELLAAPDLHGASDTGLRPGVGPGALIRWMLRDRAVLLGAAAWRWLPSATPSTSYRIGMTARLHLGAASLQVTGSSTPRARELALSLLAYID